MAGSSFSLIVGALAALLAACNADGYPELHLHLEDAVLRPVIYSYVPGDNIHYGLGFELGRDPLTINDLIHNVEDTPVGLRLVIPFDLGWPGPPRGPHWMPDPGYPTGAYAAPMLIDGRRKS